MELCTPVTGCLPCLVSTYGSSVSKRSMLSALSTNSMLLVCNLEICRIRRTLKGGRRDAPPPPPGCPNSFDFMRFSGNFEAKSYLGAPSGQLAPSPPPPARENPGSAAEFVSKFYRETNLWSMDCWYRELPPPSPMLNETCHQLVSVVDYAS